MNRFQSEFNSRHGCFSVRIVFLRAARCRLQLTRITSRIVTTFSHIVWLPAQLMLAAPVAGVLNTQYTIQADRTTTHTATDYPVREVGSKLSQSGAVKDSGSTSPYNFNLPDDANTTVN